MTVTNANTFVTVVENKVEEAVPSSSVAAWIRSNWKNLSSEAASTFILVFLGCASTIPIDGLEFMPIMYAPLTFGLVAMINTQTFGHISGPLGNPSLTLVAVFWGKISIVSGIFYLIAQLAGALSGCWILSQVSPVNFAAEGICVTLPHERLSEWQAIVVELILTATLCLVNNSLWDPVNENKQDSAAIKFALTIAALSFAGGPLTGASMNPIRSLAPVIVTGVWRSHWVYWVGPLSGAFLSCIYIFLWLGKPK